MLWLDFSEEFYKILVQLPEEQYLDFLRRHPNLFNPSLMCNNASYLGVTPEFLSTVRKKNQKS